MREGIKGAHEEWVQGLDWYSEKLKMKNHKALPETLRRFSAEEGKNSQIVTGL